MKTVRMSTILKKYGEPVYWADSVEAYKILGKDADRNKVITIHHGDSDKDAWYGEVGVSCCNIVGFAIFRNPFPADISLVIGVGGLMNTLAKNPI